MYVMKLEGLPAQDVEVTKGKFKENSDWLDGANQFKTQYQNYQIYVKFVKSKIVSSKMKCLFTRACF
jgi:hypothetical protein